LNALIAPMALGRRPRAFARRTHAAIVDDMKLTYLFAGTFLILAAGLGAGACTDNSGNGTGNPGTAGSKSGTGGAGTAGGGGASTGGAGGASTGGGGGASGGAGGASTGGTSGAGGGTPGFMSLMPCVSEGDYVTGTGDAGTAGMPTVNFGTINGVNTYDPKCLKTVAGSTVTFSGNFGFHPLVPSTVRGNTTNSPITTVASNPDGGKMSFTFPTAGFYAFYCGEHGTDAGEGMAGVIWVR
jgi:plastocyanin